MNTAPIFTGTPDIQGVGDISRTVWAAVLRWLWGRQGGAGGSGCECGTGGGGGGAGTPGGRGGDGGNGLVQIWSW